MTDRNVFLFAGLSRPGLWMIGPANETAMTIVLPLVKLSVLRPFVQELRDRGLDPTPVFESVGLSETAIRDPSLSVHVMAIHQFVENSAAAAGDRFLGAMVGNKLDIDGWPVLADADARASTVGDFLSIFITRASEIATSVTEYLNITGGTAVFGEKRAFEPTILPAQNDAFMVALGWAILRRALKGRIDPTKVTVVVSDPRVLPPDFDLMHPMKGDRMGFSIRFPSQWLSSSFDAGSFTSGGAANGGIGTSEFIHSFRQMLRSHVGQGSLTAGDCAKLASMSPQKLKRRMAAFGTDTSMQIDIVQQEYARTALADTTRSVADIAAALGFADPANFTRSFRRANGVTPSKFRKTSQSPKSRSEN